jgi:hypothetical protein
MISSARTIAALSAAALAAAAPAHAQEPGGEDRFDHSVGADFFISSDADDTSVIRTGVNLDFDYDSPEVYRGIRLEKAWFNPIDRGWVEHERVYVRAADSVADWKWNAQVGTDGDTLLGTATVFKESKLRPEFFVEREIVETPQGLDRGIYYTFAGAAVDLPADDRNIFTAFAGVQEFTGDNVRTHLRGNYIHVLDPDRGISAQLRTRYFHNSDPREFDYYSPRWYAQVLPVVQLRRFSGGWRYLVAGGVGIQRDATSDWRRSSYFNAQVTSPVRGKLQFNAGLLYSETPTGVGNSYEYLQFNIGLARRF